MTTACAMEGREFVVVSHDGGGGDGVLGELRELRWWRRRRTLSPVTMTPVSSFLPLSVIPSQSSFDPPEPQFHLAPHPTSVVAATMPTSRFKLGFQGHWSQNYPSATSPLKTLTWRMSGGRRKEEHEGEEMRPKLSLDLLLSNGSLFLVLCYLPKTSFPVPYPSTRYPPIITPANGRCHLWCPLLRYLSPLLIYYFSLQI